VTRFHPFLPPWTELDADLHARLSRAIDPERHLLAALERIVPLGGKRVADIGTGIGHYPLLLARRTGRTYGIESDPELLDEARRRVAEAHQPNLRIIAGSATHIPLRDGAVDVVLTGLVAADDDSLPAIAEALRVLRPGGRLVVVGHYGRDDVAALLEPEVVRHALDATQRRTGWWLRHGFKIKVVHARLDLGDEATAHELLPRLYGDRGRAYLMGPHRSSLELKLALFHRAREDPAVSAPQEAIHP
jgi:SAM-dependent methyltransferase